MGLSEELSIPILVVVQANRGGVVDKYSTDTPELENIRDSDGIAQNASMVFSVRQKQDENELPLLIIDKKKSRIGKVGISFYYRWDIDRGEFTWTEPDDTTTERPRKREKKEPTVSTKEKEPKSAEDAF
jgi:hypothetical protein